LRSGGSGTGSTQPREYNWRATSKSSGSCLVNREYCRSDQSRWPRGTLSPQKLVLASPTNGGRSVGIVRSRTQTMEFSLVLVTNFITWFFITFWYTGMESALGYTHTGWNLVFSLTWENSCFCAVVQFTHSMSNGDPEVNFILNASSAVVRCLTKMPEVICRHKPRSFSPQLGSIVCGSCASV
jgi:hypothetical protein